MTNAQDASGWGQKKIPNSGVKASKICEINEYDFNLNLNTSFSFLRNTPIL